MSIWNVIELVLILWACLGVWMMTIIDFDNLPRDEVVVAAWIIFSLGPVGWLMALFVWMQEALKRRKS